MWVVGLAGVALASVVDRVVAVVGTEVVLQSDLALDDDLEGLDPSPLPFWRRGTASSRQIDAAVLRTAAGDISLYQPTDAAVDERLQGLRLAVVGPGQDGERAWMALLARWGLDERGMSSVLKRRLVVEAYLSRNLRTPAGDPTWAAECDALVAQLRARVRVRAVPEVSP
jgi:hypothetical protein